MSKSITRLLEVTCCSPRGADLLSGWFAVTVLLGALVLAGNALFAVSVDLGLMDFMEGGEITEAVMGCKGQEILSGNRTLAVLNCWDDSQKDLVFWLVTLLDSAWALVYAPFLALLFVRLFSGLAADRRGGSTRPGDGDRAAVLSGESWPLRVTLFLVLGLLLADLTENILAWVVTLGSERQAPDVWLLALGWVSFVKLWLVRILVVLAGVVLALWFFGAFIESVGSSASEAKEPAEDSATPHEDRAKLRRAIGSIVWRSRYVLAMLGVFGVVTLGMDQSRDVLVGMAEGFNWTAALLFMLGFVLVVSGSVIADTPRQRWLILVLLLIFSAGAVLWDPVRIPLVMLLSVIAVWMFAYVCWLWSRILSRLCPPDVSPSIGVYDGRDQFAKWWARWLGLIPLLLLIALAGKASGDATLAWLAGMHAPDVLAASQARGNNTGVALFVLAFVSWLLALLIQIGFLFDQGRQRERVRGGSFSGAAEFKKALEDSRAEFSILLARESSTAKLPTRTPPKQTRYYNAVGSTPEDAAAELAQDLYRFPMQIRQAPLTLPLIALGAFELVRALDLVLGGGTPLALAAIAFVLTLWSGVLGLVTQAAQRQGMPWVLFVVVLVGVLGFFGLTDNHRVLTTAYTWTGAGLLWAMLLAQALLALVLALALLWSWKRLVAIDSNLQPQWMQGWLDGYGRHLDRHFAPSEKAGASVRGAGVGVLLRRVWGIVLGAFKLPWLVLRALPGIVGALVSGVLAQLKGSEKTAAKVNLSPRQLGASQQSLLADVAFLYGLAALIIPVMLLANWLLAPAPAQGDAHTRQHSLERAIRDWVETRNLNEGDVPVYFVSAEGGGIRAAYWAALVLDRLDRSDHVAKDFSGHVFSISGVSGGSIGAAVWAVCRDKAGSADTPQERESCIGALAQANLLTPLLSAWMFEDVLASVIPTSLQIGPVRCDTPGCGFLSRGHLFERSLEAALPALARPLVEQNKAAPYLFLNSTRVEDGSRAIASALRMSADVEPVGAARSLFPSSVDQLADIADTMPLSTAAHNSSRFTYVNAIGAAGKLSDRGFEPRYHLADGGYFDNSGGHTTADIIRAFTRCLFHPANPCEIADTALREEARKRLVPQAIHIRNGVDPLKPHAPATPSRQESVAPIGCPAVSGKPVKNLDIYPNVIGPAVTALNTIGTGANGRVAEAEVCNAVQAWRLLHAEAVGAAPPASERHSDTQVRTLSQTETGAMADDHLPLVRKFDLVDEGVLSPLGWYLSPTARGGMENAALHAIPLAPTEGSTKPNAAATSQPPDARGQ